MEGTHSTICECDECVEMRRAAGSSAPACSALHSLLTAIRQCEQERLTAQMSGFETGWEHPNTQSMWRRVHALAEIVISQNIGICVKEGKK